MVPVFNPHDADKGFSSQHAVPSAGPVTATTTNTVATAPASEGATSYWHPVGTIVSAALSYYMGNDPCRTIDRTRRRLGAGDQPEHWEECIGTDDTLEKHVTFAPSADGSEPERPTLFAETREDMAIEPVEVACVPSDKPPAADPGKVKTGPTQPVGAPVCDPPVSTQEWTIYGIGGVLLLALLVMALR